MPPSDVSPGAFLDVIEGELKSLIVERDAELAEVQQKIREKYDGDIQALKVTFDLFKRKGTPDESGTDEDDPEADAPSRLPVNWLAQETLRFAADTGRFFHVNELDERLAARLEEDFPDADQLVLQEKAGSRTLRKLWKRGEVARVTYGSHSRHYFHGSPELVRYGFDGPEFVSPRVAPPAEFLEGVEKEPPQFPEPE